MAALRKLEHATLAKLISKIGPDGRTTIPLSVRRRLDLKSGDLIKFKIGKSAVEIAKADHLDIAFSNFADEAFADWHSAEDAEAFDGL